MSQTVCQDEVIKNMDGFVRDNLYMLKPISESWQPQDLLPDMTSASWHDEITLLQKRAKNIPDEVLVVLVGNLVTEEALPSYQTWLNRIDEIKDLTGADDTPWAHWTRGWTAEENRHGDVLNKYLYLTGRLNMRSVEITIQHLISAGFDLRSGQDAYRSLVYASFQERGTKISHANTAKLAENCGDVHLAKICATIAGDEARHEEAYKRFFKEIVRTDPARAVIAFAGMMREKIAMPARFMSDGTDRNLFNQFAVVAQKIGVYQTRDYAEIISHLTDYWQIASLTGLSGEASKAQDYVCGLSDYYMGKADRIEEAVANLPKEPFSWIFERTA